jgi:hypothetical protein
MDKLMAFLTIMFPFMVACYLGGSIWLVPWLMWPAAVLVIIGGVVYQWNHPPWRR